MSARGIILVCFAFLIAAPFKAEAAPPQEVQLILKERLVGKHDLRLDGLQKYELTPERVNQLKHHSTYERYKIPYPRGMADYFSYSIYRFKSTGEIWITKSGGVAGVFELFIVSQKP